MELNRDNILRITDKGLSVFRHYIDIPFRVGRNFLNPLYEDKHASCNIFFDRRNDCYRMKDFGNDDFSGDCFAFVGKIHGLDCRSSRDFVQIMETINNELHLGLSTAGTFQPERKPEVQSTASAVPTIPITEKPYSIRQTAFSPSQLVWWKQYGIAETTLRQYNVIALKRFDSVSREDKPFYLVSSETEPMYGYTGQQRIKVYRPLSAIRFLQAGKTNGNYCFGLEQLPAKGDLLFVTGGEKDVLALAAHGFNAISFNSETSNIPPEIIRKLSYRFKHIILLFDVDKTGLQSAEKQQQALQAYGVKRLHLPLSGTKQEKDVADYFRLGIHTMI